MLEDMFSCIDSVSFILPMDLTQDQVMRDDWKFRWCFEYARFACRTACFILLDQTLDPKSASVTGLGEVQNCHPDSLAFIGSVHCSDTYPKLRGRSSPSALASPSRCTSLSPSNHHAHFLTAGQLTKRVAQLS